MAGFGKNVFFQLQLDPGESESLAGGAGKIRGKAFEELAGNSSGLGTENFAQGVVIDGLTQIVLRGRAGQGGNGKNSRAENRLGLAAFGIRHAKMAGELQVNEGERGGHGQDSD